MSKRQLEGLFRLHQIIGDSEKGIEPIIPMSRSAWLKGVAEGYLPQPIKIGRLNFWIGSEIQALLERK